MYHKNLTKFLLLSIFLFLPSAANSFFQNGTVALIKGTLIEESTNNPIGTTIQFTDSQGKTVDTRSNSQSGAFQQVLKADESYRIAAKGYIISEGQKHFGTPDSDEYVEFDMNFTAKKIAEGLQIAHFQAFKPNDSTLTEEAKEKFKDLKSLLRFNIGVTVNIEISSYDSHLKKKTVKEYYTKNGRKRYRWKKLSTEDRLQELLDAREKAVKEYFDEIKIFLKNVDFSRDLQIVSETKKREKRKKKSGRGYEYYIPDFPNVKITVSKVRTF